MNAESARTGNDRSLSAYRYSHLSSVNIRVSKSAAPIETFEWDLHDLWHAYYHAAINTSHESPNMDSLAFQLLQAKGQGVLMRRGSQVTDAEEAITSDGSIWTDLPFLVPDMTSYWIHDYAKMSASQRLNLASFLAKLACIGLNNDRLSGIALIVLRDALETRRPIGDLNDQEIENTLRLEADVSIGSLLLAVNAWLFTAGLKIIQLSDKQWNNCPTEVGKCGDLVLENGGMDAGFSPARWLFWLRRLEGIAADARQAGKEALVKHVQGMMDNMLLIVGDTESAVKKALDDAGGAVEYKPTMRFVGPPNGQLV